MMTVFARPNSSVVVPHHSDRDARPPTRFVEASIPEAALALKSNPALPHLVAVGGAQNYGIAGKGSVSVFSIPTENLSNKIIPAGPQKLTCLGRVYTDHAVQDCSWHESCASVLAAACGDGLLHLFQLASSTKFPVDSVSSAGQLLVSTASVVAHRRECSSLDWNAWNSDLLVSSSWDGSANFWQVGGATDIRKLFSIPSLHGGAAVHRVTWHPSQPSVIASCGADGCFRVVDIRANQRTTPDAARFGPAPAARLFTQGRAHDGEALCIDWNKFFPYILATSGADAIVRVWDIRNLKSPLSSRTPHKLGVKQLRWSPHMEHLVATSSFDTTVAVWWNNRPDEAVGVPLARGNSTSLAATGGATAATAGGDSRGSSLGVHPVSWSPHVFSHHCEFVSGLDWSLHVCGLLGSAGWDGRVVFWDAAERVGTATSDLVN